jgi:hypothetical protein
MSAQLDSLLDRDRLADCLRNDIAMRTATHAHLLNNVRRYPRSMAEAFPDVRAQAVERYVPPLWKRVLVALWRWA